MKNKIKKIQDIYTESQQKLENYREKRDELFPKIFQSKFNYFMLGYQKVKIHDIAGRDNHNFLFKTFDEKLNINPIFKYLDEETQAENKRWGDTTFATYLFSEIDVVNFPIRIDITSKIIDTSKKLLTFTKNNSKIKRTIDIEFYEKISLDFDSKNQQMKSIISDYLKDGGLSEEELKEIDNLMSLEDMEKIHTKFLVFEDNSIVMLFIGIGTNKPYGICKKSKTNSYGRNRFYKYDLEHLNEQESIVKLGRDVDFKNEIIFEDEIFDGTRFAIHNSEGVAILNGKKWSKAILEQPSKNLTLDYEISKNNSLDFLKLKLQKTYINFDKYAQIAYDPLEILLSFGHEKTAQHLYGNKLLRRGYEIPINVASDLYNNGYVNISGLKPSLILMYHMIDTGKFEELILNTAKKLETVPYKNL